MPIATGADERDVGALLATRCRSTRVTAREVGVARRRRTSRAPGESGEGGGAVGRREEDRLPLDRLARELERRVAEVEALDREHPPLAGEDHLGAVELLGARDHLVRALERDRRCARRGAARPRSWSRPGGRRSPPPPGRSRAPACAAPGPNTTSMRTYGSLQQVALALEELRVDLPRTGSAGSASRARGTGSSS